MFSDFLRLKGLFFNSDLRGSISCEGHVFVLNSRKKFTREEIRFLFFRKIL